MNPEDEIMHVVPVERHNAIIAAAYRARGYNEDETQSAVRIAQSASWHGVRTHNGIKAVSLDDHFGSKVGGCVPRAVIEKRPTRFAATEVWNANRKLGQPVAEQAIETCIALADRYGIGQVSVDNAFHYLWGGGYVMEAARRGYVAYTNCTSAKTGVVPFGQHKGYGLALADELFAALIGGSLPTLRGREPVPGAKQTPCFYFQVIHPEALSGGAFGSGLSQAENVKAVLADILSHGNEHCLLPGELEARWAKKCAHNNGLLFSRHEIRQLNQIATACGEPELKIDAFPEADMI